MKKLDFEKIAIIILAVLLGAFLIVGTLVFREVMNQESRAPVIPPSEVQGDSKVPSPSFHKTNTQKGNQ